MRKISNNLTYHLKKLGKVKQNKAEESWSKKIIKLGSGISKIRKMISEIKT